MAVKQSDFKPKPKGLDLSSTGKSLQASREGRGPSGNGALAGLLQVDTNVKTGADIQQIPLAQLVPYSQPEFGFREQPFKVIENAEMAELAEDINQNGIHQALIVRPHGEGYMLLAGHRRHRAAQIAGLASVPCVVRNVDDSTAAQIVVQTNMLHRQKLLPSEKAFAYKLRLEAMKQQGKRNDLTSSPMETKSTDAAETTLSPLETKLPGKRSDEILAEEVGESRAQIARFVRLTFLTSTLLEQVDSDKIPIRAGISLSYLSQSLQSFVAELLQETGKTMTIELAEQLRNAQPMDEDTIQSILIPQPAEKVPKEPKEPKPRIVKILFADLQEFFPDSASDDEITQCIRDSLAVSRMQNLAPAMEMD